MANRIKTVTVPAADRAELQRRARSQTGSARDARRARIVLLAAEGRPAAEIAELGGLFGQHRRVLARPLPPPRPGRAGRPAAVGTSRDSRRR